MWYGTKTKTISMDIDENDQRKGHFVLDLLKWCKDINTDDIDRANCWDIISSLCLD